METVIRGYFLLKRINATGLLKDVIKAYNAVDSDASTETAVWNRNAASEGSL
jgi:hypothetical protein